MYQLAHFRLFAVNYLSCQHTQQVNTLLFVQLFNHESVPCGQLCRHGRKTRRHQISTIVTANLQGERVFRLPGIVEHEQHRARSNRSTQCLTFLVLIKFSKLGFRYAKKSCPSTQESCKIGCWSKTSPQNAITKIFTYFRIMSERNRKTCFSYPWNPVESDEDNTAFSLPQRSFDTFEIVFTPHKSVHGKWYSNVME